jgi:CHAT domain-containing protein
MVVLVQIDREGRVTSSATAIRSAFRSRLLLAVVAAAALLSSPGHPAAAGSPLPPIADPARSPAEPRPLAANELLEAEIGGGEEHRYRIELTAGHAWLLNLEQIGVDVVLAAVAPGGGDAVESNSPLHRDGAESLLIEPAADAPWDVVVRSEEAELIRGRYRLRAEPLSAASEAELARIEAEKAFSDAGIQHQRDTPETERQALESCRRAGDLWRRLGDPRQTARADHCAGALARATSEPQLAEEALRRAAESWRALGEPALAVHALNELGLVLWQGGDLAAAQAVFEEGLANGLAERRPALDAATRNNLCLILHYRGELDSARACYEEALPRAEALGDPDLVATLATNLGAVHYLLGEPEPALVHYRRALGLRRANEQRQGEADVLNNLSALHMATAEFQEALLGYERTLEIYRELEDLRGEARTLNNLGNVYLRLGDRDRARGFYERALPLRRKAHDPRGEAVTLNNLGNLLRLDGQPQAALAHHRSALELRGTLGHRRGEGMTLQLMGRAYLGLEDAGSALDHLDRAAAALREVGDRRNLGETLRFRSEALAPAGRYAEAETALREALALYRSAGDRSGEATTKLALGELDVVAGREVAALDNLQTAIALLESLRAGLDAPDLRASYLASQLSAYERLVDLHLANGRAAQALEVAETASARSLLDLVQEALSDLPRSIDPELAEQREELERELRIKIDRRFDLDEATDHRQVERLEGEIDALLTSLDAVEARFRGASTSYADLTRPPLLSSAEIRGLLDPETVLLRYALGEERSWLWRVTTADVAVHELPPRQRLEELARAVHEELAVLDAGDRDGRTAARELATLLLGPVTAELGDRRLLVVADGALHYVPFGALPVPGETGAVMLDRNEIVTAPSMSVLALQRERLQAHRKAPRSLAVVADPVFDAFDHRVAAASSGEGTSETGAAGVRRGGNFARLRFSRREAEAIAGLVPAAERFVALDFEANRDTILGGALAPFRIVHFATHGVLDTERPELSGLVLSRVDADGRPRLGLLGLRDIYDLSLAADLVVLSGCRTALGREVRGEGLVGLTRGFLYAGVPRVVASLWQVDDRATAELMSHFYRGMLTEGLAPGEALRGAQLALRADDRTRDPYYWAPFVLQGDWRSAAAVGNPAVAGDTQ